jgi:ABC-type polysaccharide/polyol phosphate export permease
MFWAVGLPLIQALVLAMVFSRVLGNRVHTKGSYAGFIVSGQVVWSFFSGALGGGSTAIVDGSSLSNRIYFPRAVMPITTILTSVYGFVISVVLMLGLVLLFGVHLGVQTLFLVPGIVLAVLLATSFSLVLSALHVYFRDIRFIVSAVTMPWFYLTPVMYPLRGNLIPHRLQEITRYNPATGMVELFRAGTAGADPGWHMMVLVTCLWTVGLFAIALALHSKYNRVFSDLM